MQSVSVDAVVVGSGMSGATVATELLRQGVQVAIIEAGPSLGLAHINSQADLERLQDPLRDPSFQPFDGSRPRSEPYGLSSGLRVRTGGRSIYWRGITLEIEDYALEHWPANVQEALGSMHGPGAYAEAREAIEEWTGRPLTAPADMWDRGLLDEFRDLGFGDAVATPRAVVSTGDPHYAAYSPLHQLPLEVVRPERSLTAVSASDDNYLTLHVSGVEGPERYLAKVAVLCAGTIPNAALLRLFMPLSGLRLPKRYRVVDHHLYGWLIHLNRRYIGGIPSSVLLERSRTASSNLFVETIPIGGIELLDVYAMGEQLSSPASTFTVSVDGQATFDVDFTNNDDAVLIAQDRLLLEAADQIGVRLICEERPTQSAILLDAAVKLAIANPNTAVPYYFPLGTAQHEAGSLPLGGDLINSHGQVKDVPRVFVAGPATFPRSGAANSSLTILALSRIVAKHATSLI